MSGNKDEKNFDHLPTHILVQGLPFMLQGWNNVFYRSTGRSDGVPIYVLPTYTLFGFIDIAPARILRLDGVWTLQKTGWGAFNVDTTRRGDEDWIDSPIGQWNQICVTDVTGKCTQVRKWLPFWFGK